MNTFQVGNKYYQHKDTYVVFEPVKKVWTVTKRSKCFVTVTDQYGKTVCRKVDTDFHGERIWVGYDSLQAQHLYVSESNRGIA